jgi:hypothetical protein
MRTINAATTKPTSSSKKASSVNDRTTDPGDVPSSLFTGRSEDSLKAEICELRDLVDCMRDFVVESAKVSIDSKSFVDGGVSIGLLTQRGVNMTEAGTAERGCNRLERGSKPNRCF